jgi:hypothetical protein
MIKPLRVREILPAAMPRNEYGSFDHHCPVRLQKASVLTFRLMTPGRMFKRKTPEFPPGIPRNG